MKRPVKLPPAAQELKERLALWRNRPDIMVRELFKATPDPWQDEVLQAFPTNPRIAMKASVGPGKAQPKDTLIPTPQGERRFGDLRVGDLVFAADGTPTKVTAIFDRGVLPVYCVSFDDSSYTYACGEHLWKVRGAAERQRKCSKQYQRATRTTEEVWSVLSTEEIIERGVYAINGGGAGRQFEIPRQEPVQYPKQKLPLDPYALGVWLGDGTRGSNRYSTKPTPEIAEKLAERGHHVSPVQNKMVTIYGISAALREVGVFDLNSHQRFVPPIYKESCEQDRRDIICGLFDTDGGCDADGHMQYATTSSQLAEDVIWLVRSLGGTAHEAAIKYPFYYTANREKIEGKPCHRVVARLPFNPFSIEQRQNRWVDPCRNARSLRYMTRYIDDIFPAGEEECMCIQVEHQDHLYLTNDFIVTHNSTVLAWCAWNFLLTRPNAQGAAVSNSADNLRDGLWKEMSFWRDKAPLLQHQFEVMSERIFQKDYKNTWFLSARSFAKSTSAEVLGQTLAGLHADHIIFLIDEAGGIPPAISTRAEAALSSSRDAHILMAGNTNSLEGALYNACVRQKSQWYVVAISGDPDDPKRASRVSVEWAREMIRSAPMGRDDPFVKVMVLGEWPEQSFNALLAASDVEAAMGRFYREGDVARSPRILGVDVARSPLGAKSALFPRQGLIAFKPTTLMGATSTQGVGQVSRVWSEWDLNACFIDSTGGFGAGWIDGLKVLGRSPVGIGFAEQAENPARYYNKRAEMYFRAATWIKEGGALPIDCPALLQVLPQITYTFKGDRLLLEPKELIEKRVGTGQGLDECDALALTFATTVPARDISLKLPTAPANENYDPFAAYC